MKKSQTWSMDAMIAIGVFISAIFVVYLIFSGSKESKAEELEKDANKVLGSIVAEGSEVAIVEGIELNEEKLQQLINEQYLDLKKKIRTENDFCIFLEDEDEKIIYLNGKVGIGSDIIKISDEPCG